VASNSRHRVQRLDNAARHIGKSCASHAQTTYGVTGEVLNIKGQQTVSFVVDGREFSHTFLACSLPTDAAGLLDTDFLNKAGVSIDFECGKMSLADIGKAPRACKVPPTTGAALTIFTEGKEGHSPQPVYGKLGIKTSSSQPAPTARRLLPRTKLGSLRLKKILLLPPRVDKL